MKTEDRDQVLAVVQQILQDNANNRLTLSLVNGIIVTARGLLHAESDQPGPEIQAALE